MEPLSGRRIAVTRSRAQAAELGDRLRAAGAEVMYCPAIRIVGPADARPFQEAVAALDSYDWLILTSTNGVRVFFDELARHGRSELPGHLHVACVGSATAAALRERGVQPAAMPAEYVGSAIPTAMTGKVASGTRILLPRGAGGGQELPEQLRALGALVTDVHSYQSVPDLDNLSELRRELAADSIDLITFTSPSTVSFLLEGLGAAPRGVALAAIGPVTAARLRELGLEPAVVAPEHSIPGLVAAIVSHFSSSNMEKRNR